MRLAVHTVICCCVFTTVLALVKGATGELNTGVKKRFRSWLQNNMKRDLHNSLVAATDVHVGPQQDGDADIVSPPPSSFRLNIRVRRSPSSKSSGCVLVTCAYHDLLHRLHQINNRQKEANAPERQIGSKGYGRRRRSLQDVVQFARQTGRQRRSTEAGQRLCGHKTILHSGLRQEWQGKGGGLVGLPKRAQQLS